MPFAISLVMKKTVAKSTATFSFLDIPSYNMVAVNVDKDDIFQNFSNKDDVTMNVDKL